MGPQDADRPATAGARRRVSGLTATLEAGMGESETPPRVWKPATTIALDLDGAQKPMARIEAPQDDDVPAVTAASPSPNGARRRYEPLAAIEEPWDDVPGPHLHGTGGAPAAGPGPVKRRPNRNHGCRIGGSPADRRGSARTGRTPSGSRPRDPGRQSPRRPSPPCASPAAPRRPSPQATCWTGSGGPDRRRQACRAPGSPPLHAPDRPRPADPRRR